MKKSLHSILTAAMFAAAVTTSLGEPSVNAQTNAVPVEAKLMDDTDREQQSVYGPPWVTGDINRDFAINSEDLTVLKRAILEHGGKEFDLKQKMESESAESISDYIFGDMNSDGKLNKEDVDALIRQLTGKPEEEDEPIQTFISNSTDITTSTVTTPKTIPLYGPPPAWK